MRHIFGILLICSASLSMLAQNSTAFTRSQFDDPPKEFRPMPLWFINGELTEEGILKQMEDAKYKAGFTGVGPLPMVSTKPEVLSEAYFQRYEFILETAKKLGMDLILYDDTGFPSGSAGGLLEKEFPDDIRKVVNKHETIRKGPSLWKMEVPHGELMAAVAMEEETLERLDISAYIEKGMLSWKVPEGIWKIMFFTVNKAPFYKSHFPVDYLDTAAVRNFMTLTYDVYARRLESYFQEVINLIFFDDVGFLRTERTWTKVFNEKFLEVNGYKPELYYPALWYDIGPETHAARVALFNTRSELMAEGYPKLVTEWAQKYGLKSTGHPPGNYAIQPVDMHGDIFKFFRYPDVPLTDFIIDYNWGKNGFKLISSASDYYDRPVTATEIYGALKEEIMDSLMLYRGLMEIETRGVNFVIPHAMWYDPESVRIPPLISPFSKKLAPGLPKYSDYVGRTCYLLQGGRRVTDIALLYPIASLQAGFYFDSPDNWRAGKWTYAEADYLKISDMLSNEIRRDFTFVHPEFLAGDKYEIHNKHLLLANEENYQEYGLVIIPGGKVISLPALQKIKLFYDQGGKVLATTLLPAKSAEIGRDDEVKKIVEEMFGTEASTNPEIQSNAKGGMALFVPNPSIEDLSAAIEELIPVADVRFTPEPELSGELGLFSYLHKVRNGKNIYFFANSSDQAVNTEVLLKGKLKLENWDPHTGSTSPIPGVKHIRKDGEIFTQCQLSLKPVYSTFWIEK